MQSQAASGWGSPASFASRLNVDIKTRIAPAMIAAPERISEVGGHYFAKIGDDWVDQSLTTTTTTLRVRVGSDAFAHLLALDARFAQWAKLGPVVRIKFGAYVIELSPNGFGDYSEDMLKRAIRHG